MVISNVDYISPKVWQHLNLPLGRKPLGNFVSADLLPQTSAKPVDLDFSSFDLQGLTPVGYANKRAAEWVAEFDKFSQCECPSVPTEFLLHNFRPGWNKWYSADKSWYHVDNPDESGLVFDTETFGSYYQYPMIGVACSKDNWYIWLSPWLFNPDRFNHELIDLDEHSLVVAHNAGFDRARCNIYKTQQSPSFLCTMSMVQSVAGASRKLVNTYKSSSKYRPHWAALMTGVSLKDAVSHFVDPKDATVTAEDKLVRDLFIDAKPDATTHKLITENWDKAIAYAVNDVKATWYLFKAILPQYVKQNPNLATLYAHSLLLDSYLPINPDWQHWLSYCDQRMDEEMAAVDAILDGLIDSALTCSNPSGDHWYSNLNWSSTSRGKVAGIPKWAVNRVTLRSRSLPYLLKLQWNVEDKQYPLLHIAKMGWCWQDSSGKVVRLPHAKEEGANVGNPLADVYHKHIDSGKLSSAIPGFDLRAFHKHYYATTYWSGSRDRISELTVINDICINTDAVHGTVTRRLAGRIWLTVPDMKEGKIGTSVKSQIRLDSDSEYRFVGADFSTQEMSIGALFSDAHSNHIVGGNDFSYVQFTGDKEKGTDSHTLLAKRWDISRRLAKDLNFAGAYLCGEKRYASYLAQYGSGDVDYYLPLARQILLAKRGTKDAWGNYVGGTDSHYYNALTSLVNSNEPRTPMLSSAMPRYVKLAGGDMFTTANNWGIQSSGVDILHLFLVLTRCFAADRRLDFSFIIPRHDEVWFKVHQNHISDFAECMQFAHLCCWSNLASNLGLSTIPAGISLFPEINVDYCIRKEVNLDVWDGFGNPLPAGYYIKQSRWMK